MSEIPLVYHTTTCIGAEGNMLSFLVEWRLKGIVIEHQVEMHDEHELIEYCLN